MAGAVGGAKMAVNAVGAYARVRKQFRVPIAEMGGVQEALVMHLSLLFLIVEKSNSSVRSSGSHCIRGVYSYFGSDAYQLHAWTA